MRDAFAKPDTNHPSARECTAPSSALLATAIEQAAEIIMITDPAGTIEYVNPAFERVTGYTRREAVGQNPRFLKSGLQDEDFYRELWRAITLGTDWKGRFTNRRKDGTLYEEEATISPVVAASGEIMNFVAVKRDVSRERILEEQLRQAQKIEVVGQFAAGIAHDFNNLLAALLGYICIAQQSLPAEHAARAALDGIERVANLAVGITKSLVTFSARSQTAMAPLRLDLLIPETVQLLRHMLPRSIPLHVDVPPEPALWVHADRTQLQQVLLNLALNARDAMPDGGTLSLSASPGRGTLGDDAPRETSVVRMVVRDTGVGMTPATRARIFEPFFTTKARGRGTGLGLAIVRGIVREHGGTVEVESTPGQGSSFTVVLPRVAASAATPHEATDVATPRGRGELILLAEDDDYVRALLTSELGRLGYVVVSAADGDALLRRYQERCGALRLLVLAFGLRVRTGGECLRLIRQGGDDVPAIMLRGGTESERLAGQTGAVVLNKPFRIAQLGDLVHGVLHGTPISGGRS